MMGENRTTDQGDKRKYEVMEPTQVHDYDGETEEDDEEVEEIEEEDEYEEGEMDGDGAHCGMDKLLEVLMEAGVFQQASGVISALPMEIFFDILSRVPVKSISQCRWVCKAWFYSIHHPLFIEMQHRRAMESNSHFVIVDEPRITNSYFLIDHEGFRSNAPEITKLPDLPRTKRILCMDSCNGLLFFQESPYAICNPITRQWVLPPTSPKDDMKDILSCFGFDSTTGKYKVMHVVESDKGCAEAEVHTLGSVGWRAIPDVPYTFRLMERNVFVSGAFHWFGTDPRKCTESEVIVSFKLGIEEFSVNPLPPFLQKNDGYYALFELGGCLSVRHSPLYERTVLWVMKTYGDQGSWSKEYVFNDIECWITEPFEPLKVMKSGELLLTSASCYLGYFDPKKETYSKFDMIWLEDHLPERSCLWQTIIHVGSLISPRDISQPTERNISEKCGLLHTVPDVL